MAKMHELLAVEADRQGQYKAIVAESMKVFQKGEIFSGSHRRLEMFEDDGINHPEERSEIASTVPKRLEYTSKTAIRYFDVLLQKEATNQVSVADLVVDGVTIASGLPATFLLGLETRLRELRAMYSVIPTLNQGINWAQDTGMGEGVWKAVNPEEKLKTMMKFKSQVLVEPTEFHPAQIEKWEEQVPVGKYIKNTWSGMITPAQKSKLLGKVDTLLAAAKKARQRANYAVVVKRTVGKELFDFING